MPKLHLSMVMKGHDPAELQTERKIITGNSIYKVRKAFAKNAPAKNAAKIMEPFQSYFHGGVCVFHFVFVSVFSADSALLKCYLFFIRLKINFLNKTPVYEPIKAIKIAKAEPKLFLKITSKPKIQTPIIIAHNQAKTWALVNRR